MLLAAHAIGDYSAQNEYIATAKNRNTPLGKPIWPMVLWAHSMVHGALVALVSQNAFLGFAEAVVHGITDFAKCEGWIDHKTDFAVHIISKFVWFGIWLILSS